MKLLEFFKDLDQFSEPIQFNAMRQRQRQRTVQGAVLTVSIFILTFIYFVYQSYLYFDGKMDPKFRQQNYVSSDIRFQLNNEMFGFDYFSVYSGQFLSQRQENEEKTYIAYVGTYTFTNGTQNQIIQLDVIKCKSPELKGMFCFDFSKIPNPILILANHHTIFSYLNLFVYKCQDVDKYKNFVPDNCADSQQIDNFLTYEPYNLAIKTQISQYNTTSQQIEYQYKSQTFINSISTVMNNELKIQNQVTKVWQGLVVQKEEIFSSPYSQQMTSQVFDRKQIQQTLGYQFLSQVTFDVDESVTYFTIQYPIFAEVLALCNSILAVLLVSGSFCKKLAQNLIRRNIFFILMKDFFSGTYLNILQYNSIIQIDNCIQEMEIFKQEQVQVQQMEQSKDDESNNNKINVPCLIPKTCQRISQKNKQNDSKIKKQEQVKDDAQAVFKQGDEFLESLRTNDDKIISKEVKLSKEIDSQTPQNSKPILNLVDKGIEVEIEKEHNPSLFSTKSHQQQLQIQVKDINCLLQQDISNNPKGQIVFQNNDIEIQQNQNESNLNLQLNKSFQVINDKKISSKLEKIIFKQKQVILPILKNMLFVIIYLEKNKNIQSKKQNNNSLISFYLNSIIIFYFVSIMSLYEKILRFFQNKRLFKKKEFLLSKGLKQQVLNEFEDHIDESLDFFTFYKEILFLKKAIMIILNKEQLAALQVIGIDIEKIKQNEESSITTDNKCIFFERINQ